MHHVVCGGHGLFWAGEIAAIDPVLVFLRSILHQYIVEESSFCRGASRQDLIPRPIWTGLSPISQPQVDIAMTPKSAGRAPQGELRKKPEYCRIFSGIDVLDSGPEKAGGA